MGVGGRGGGGGRLNREGGGGDKREGGRKEGRRRDIVCCRWNQHIETYFIIVPATGLHVIVACTGTKSFLQVRHPFSSHINHS